MTETNVLVHVITSEGDDIRTTMFHPFYVKSTVEENGSRYNGEWKAASNLIAGDELLTEDGRVIYVEEVRIERLAKNSNIYNLEVEKSHTYFVANGILVHNECEIYGSGELPDELDISDSQLGKKWGKHKQDYPNLTSYNDYKQLAYDIFYNPEKIVFDKVEGELYHINGEDLLRVKESGAFVSLYPGVNSAKVVKAISRLIEKGDN